MLAMRHAVTVFIAALAVGAFGQAASAQNVTRDAAACATLSSLQIPGLPLSITKAEWMPAGSTSPASQNPGAPPPATLPAYCRLDGVLDRRTGADGKSYGIGFALALPGDWNGRLLFQGGGGLNGNVGFPLGAAAAGGQPALTRGFAVVSTDTGHQGQVFDATFTAEQQAMLDFAYQAVGRVAELAKQILARHYAKPPDRSYFAGCSTGGREGMLMTQRYPRYFDGVISGAPAMRTNFSGIGDEWVATMLNTVAPKNPQGVPQVRQALSDSDKKLVIDGALNACDANDGLKDGMIFDQLSCKFDPKVLACKGAKTDSCLTMEQAVAIEKGFAGPKDSKGRQVYTGFFYDTGLASTVGIPGLLHGGLNPVGPPFSATSMDVDTRAAAAAADPAEALVATSRWTNLNTFSSHGGKLIFFHGVSDPWFSAQDTIDYYDRMAKANGGAAQVMNWSRLFLVPGMGHCAGGPAALDQFDLLTALVDWVEKGTAPNAVPATGRALPGRSRPLCAYPQHTHYKGTGDPQDARNFECRP
jgi:hypothetical protein